MAIETQKVGREDLGVFELVESLRSHVCPVCGGGKSARMTMCRRDYKQLPRELQHALYSRVGAGYEEAMKDCMTHFGIEELVVPAVGGA